MSQNTLPITQYAEHSILFLTKRVGVVYFSRSLFWSFFLFNLSFLFVLPRFPPRLFLSVFSVSLQNPVIRLLNATGAEKGCLLRRVIDKGSWPCGRP